MNRLEALGLVETTSIAQRKNGTVRYHDPITGADYMSYQSGYIRRAYTTNSWRTGKPIRTIYQLNSTHKVNTKWGESTQRILIHDENLRIDRLIRAAANYRVSVIKQEEQVKAWKLKRENDIFMTVFQDSVNQYFEGNLSFEMAVHEIKETLAEISKR